MGGLISYNSSNRGGGGVYIMSVRGDECVGKRYEKKQGGGMIQLGVGGGGGG